MLRSRRSGWFSFCTRRPPLCFSWSPLGVYQGEFSAHCRRILDPGWLTLIDHWDYSKYEFVLESAPQSRQIRTIFKQYFGGDPENALQAAYGKVLDRFHGDSAVEVLRLDIAEAAGRFAQARWSPMRSRMLDKVATEANPRVMMSIPAFGDFD